MNVEHAKSPEMERTWTAISVGMYEMSRWTLAAILHPVATFKAVSLVGNQEQIDQNVERALSLPSFPIGHERLRK